MFEDPEPHGCSALREEGVRLDRAPQWLQKAVLILPLSPFLRALRAVYNDGAPLRDHVAGLAILAAWAVLSFLFAVKRFRWV